MSTLGDAADFLSGGTPKKGNPIYWGGDIPWFSASNMDRRFLSDSEIKITDAGLEAGSRLAPRGATLLLVRGSGLFNSIPICFAEEPVAFNQDVKAICAKDHVDPTYLHFWIETLRTRLSENIGVTGIGAGKFDTDFLKSLPFPDISKNEQEEISIFASSFDRRIELNRRTNETLEELARAIFKDWFVDFGPTRAKQEGREPYLTPEIWSLFPDKFDIEGRPKGWRVCELGKLADILNGYAFKSADYVNEGLFLLRTKNFSSEGCAELHSDDVHLPTNYADEYQKYLCEPFDFHVVMVAASLGKTAYIFPHMLPALRNQNMWCFRPKRTFPFRFFLNLSVKEKISHVMGWGSGSARDFFRKSDFKKHPITVCENALLDKFEPIAAAFYEQISANHHQNKTLAQTRDLLLPKLMSGEIRVRDAEKQVGEAA